MDIFAKLKVELQHCDNQQRLKNKRIYVQHQNFDVQWTANVLSRIVLERSKHSGQASFANIYVLGIYTQRATKSKKR